jgi:hypothetical protein
MLIRAAHSNDENCPIHCSSKAVMAVRCVQWRLKTHQRAIIMPRGAHGVLLFHDQLHVDRNRHAAC